MTLQGELDRDGDNNDGGHESKHGQQYLWKKNMVNNAQDWVVDIRATRHICNDKSAFTSYTPTSDGEMVYLGNSRMLPIARKGKVLLKITSENVLTLNDVLYVKFFCCNLVSGSLLGEWECQHPNFDSG